MSATLDAEQFREYFGADAPLMVRAINYDKFSVITNLHYIIESAWSYVPRRNLLHT